MGAAVLTSEGQVGYDVDEACREYEAVQLNSAPYTSSDPPTSFFLLTVFEFRHVYSLN